MIPMNKTTVRWSLKKLDRLSTSPADQNTRNSKNLHPSDHYHDDLRPGDQYHDDLMYSTKKKKRARLKKRETKPGALPRIECNNLHTERGLSSPRCMPPACAQQVMRFCSPPKPNLTSLSATVVALSANVCLARAWAMGGCCILSTTVRTALVGC